MPRDVGPSSSSENQRERQSSAGQDQVEQQLRVLALVLDQIQDLVTITDLEGRITYVNQAECRLLNLAREDIIGRSTALYGDDPTQGATQREILREALTQGQWRGEVTNRTADGAPVILDAWVQLVHDSAGRPLALCGIARDITAQKQLERERLDLERHRQQALKDKSLGRMAGAIAHNFNNQLTGVQGFLELLREQFPPDDPLAAEYLGQALESARRAIDLSHLMLTYVGQSVPALKPCDLSAAVQRIIPLIQSTMPPRCQVETTTSAENLPILASEDALRLMLVSLVTNAWEAYGEAGGAVRVQTGTGSPCDHPWGRCLFTEDLPPGKQVCLEVSDQGCGLDSAALSEMFDPFYTTKFTGRGLGLPAALGIVRSHQGAICVDSAPGRGTTLRIYFPRSGTPLESTRAAPSVGPGQWQGGGTVLLAEDETAVRRLTTHLLQRLGFEVLAVKDGAEAIAALEQQGDGFTCVLTDLTMPGLDGWQVLQAVREQRPDLPVILASGYDLEQLLEARESPERPSAFLRKPFRLSTLKEALVVALGLGQDLHCDG